MFSSKVDQPDSFDLVVEKGTFDAMLAENGSPLFPSEKVLQDLDKALLSISSVLKASGHFVSITLGQPHFRKKYLEKRMQVVEVIDLGFYFCYVMKKRLDNQVL